jgi:hypothetical protein
VREILLGDDDEWKDNLLLNIVDEIPREQQLALKQEVDRIAKNPTKGEKDMDCDESAKEILKKLESPD